MKHPPNSLVARDRSPRERGFSPVNSERWPEVMKADAGNLMNVIVFEAQGESLTRLQSYGVGYRDLQEYDDLMKFFISANEGLFEKLKEHLEN